MNIETKFYGNIEIEENRVLNFKDGIPGFEQLKNFTILDVEGGEHLKCLQSLEKIEVCLMMVSPWDYFKDYEIELSDEDVEDLEIVNEGDVLIYNVLTVRENSITANLAAPIIINIINNKAKQIILSNPNYNIRQEIPC